MVRIRFRRFYECDTEAERDLTWGSDSLIFTADSLKWWRILDGAFVEVLEEEIFFQSPIPFNKLQLSGTPDGTKFVRDDGALATVDSHYLGTFSSLVALQTAFPTAQLGDTADVDPGPGEEAVKYHWDADEGWVAGGSGSSFIEVVAAADILAFNPIKANGTIPDSSTINDRNKIVGITLEDVLNTFTAKVISEGPVTNPAWSWTRGDRIFLNGTSLSTTVPGSGFVQSIGVAIAADTILVQISPGILI